MNDELQDRTLGYLLNGTMDRQPYDFTQQYQRQIQMAWLTHCAGKAHVFECDHVDTCRCGKIVRRMDDQKNG